MNKKRAQHEMVGFVLIVVIVVVGLFVFLIFLIGQSKIKETDMANNLLTTILRTTSECSLINTPQGNPKYLDIRELFKLAYDGKDCVNQQRLAINVLNETLTDILDDILLLEPKITAYQLDFVHSNPEGNINVLRIIDGYCDGTVYGSSPHPISLTGSGNNKLEITLTICLHPISE